MTALLTGNVVHCKKAKHDVYIGRPSMWGNPFEIGRDGNRSTVIQKFRAYVLKTPKLIQSLPFLRGKVLGCWCSPLPCHGEVLVELCNAELLWFFHGESESLFIDTRAAWEAFSDMDWSISILLGAAVLGTQTEAIKLLQAL